MNYNGKFGFYNPKTKQAQVFDGSKREQVLNEENGIEEFFIPTIFEGKCSKEEYNKLIKATDND